MRSTNALDLSWLDSNIAMESQEQYLKWANVCMYAIVGPCMLGKSAKPVEKQTDW